MKRSFTAAFIGITKSGEVYIIRQQKCSSIIVANRWLRGEEPSIKELYGEHSNEIKKTTLKY